MTSLVAYTTLLESVKRSMRYAARRTGSAGFGHGASMSTLTVGAGEGERDGVWDDCDHFCVSQGWGREGAHSDRVLSVISGPHFKHFPRRQALLWGELEPCRAPTYCQRAILCPRNRPHCPVHHGRTGISRPCKLLLTIRSHTRQTRPRHASGAYTLPPPCPRPRPPADGYRSTRESRLGER